MIKSILAGFMIALSAAIYLSVGGVIGAFMFSIGLLSILYFQYSLFTGKAGMLAEGAIRPERLVLVWLGNLIGCAAFGALMFTTHLGPPIA